MKNLIVLLFALLLSLTATADTSKSIDMKKDFDSLGDNDAVIQRAKALDPKNKYKVVQGRTVDRNMKLELGISGGLKAGGDPYYSSMDLGANLDFHFSPYWSVGARYYHSYNSLTSEGQAAYQSAEANPGTYSNLPAQDYASDTALGVVEWYPLYGKLDIFEKGISHFDLYTLAGYGDTFLTSGAAGTLALGGGLAFWWTQHFTSRLETRYQTYTDHPYVDNQSAVSRQINEVVFMLSMGILL
jgi:outer membrane immunogenic protein